MVLTFFLSANLISSAKSAGPAVVYIQCYADEKPEVLLGPQVSLFLLIRNFKTKEK